MNHNLTHLEIKAMELENTIEGLSAELLSQQKELYALKKQIELCEKRLLLLQEEKQAKDSQYQTQDERPPHY